MAKKKKATQQPNSVKVRATRNFNQMVRGETAIIDLNDKYWSDEIVAGNLEVVE